MNKEAIRDWALKLGFEACGFAAAHEVDDAARIEYEKWIKSGKHFEMHYLEKYDEVRNNPQLLLEGAKTIICVALNYYPKQFQSKEKPQFAYYAYGKDYHYVIKNRLNSLAVELESRYGGSYRACVDTAPLRERYWAQQSGIGFVARNNQIIIPNKGSYFFLGFLLTTLNIEADEPCNLTCGECRRCIAYCPTQALCEEGALDSRKCISSLSIEYRGELPEGIDFGNRIYGCDTCQKACPHNRNAKPTEVEDFTPSEEFMGLTYDSISAMSTTDFNRIFRHSAIKRVNLDMLLRNLKLKQ